MKSFIERQSEISSGMVVPQDGDYRLNNQVSVIKYKLFGITIYRTSENIDNTWEVEGTKPNKVGFTRV